MEGLDGIDGSTIGDSLICKRMKNREHTREKKGRKGSIYKAVFENVQASWI